MRRLVRPVVVLAIAAAGAAPAGQHAAPLFGVVSDITGHPLPGVTVFVHRAGEGTLDTTETDSAGRYDVNLPAGKYSVDFDLVAFDVRRANGVVIPEHGIAAPVDATLSVGVMCECGGSAVDGTNVAPVSGRIADDQDRPIPHAVLELTGAAPVRVRALSGRNGEFTARLPIGRRVTLTVTDAFFENATRDITAKVDHNAPIEIRLRPRGADALASGSIPRACRCPGEIFTHPDR